MVSMDRWIRNMDSNMNSERTKMNADKKIYSVECSVSSVQSY